MSKILFGLIVLLVLSMFLLLSVMYGLKPYKTALLWLRDERRMNRELYPEFGFWLYAGLGGSGKSIAMVEYAYRMKKKYPKLMVVSNMQSLSFSEGVIAEWQDLINTRNPRGDQFGVLFIFDEIQLTLSSDKWKNAPSNVLEYVSQQRKMYKHIIGSSQVFERVNIKLREQANFIVEVSNIKRRWIFERAFNRMVYTINGDKKDEGQKKRKRSWKYDFIATDEIRLLFDTYELQVDLYDDSTKKTVNVAELKEFLESSS